jgi:hypothetical protein
MFTEEKVIPLTLGELGDLFEAVPKNKMQPETKIQIIANEERVCLKDLNNQMTLSWIRRKAQSVSG